jgi:hypothetical protein
MPPETLDPESQRSEAYRRATVAAALERAGILPAAKVDGITRGITAFPLGRVLDAIELQQWVEGLKITAHHLFAAPAQAAPDSTPEPDWNAMPPMARLTKFREMHPQPPRRPR